MNRHTKIIILIILGLVAITAASFAMWSITVKQTNENIVQSACLNITSTEQNDIQIGSAWPISDAEGALLTPYTLTITNQCDTSVNYVLLLEKIENDSVTNDSDYLNSNYVKVKLNNDDPFIYGEQEIVDNDSNANYDIIETRKLTQEYIQANATVTISVRLWVDNDTPQTDANGSNAYKKFFGKVKAIVSPNISNIIYDKHYDSLVFDGTNYINTGVCLFCSQNINNNFEISFNIDNYQLTEGQATLLNSKLEISPYPGFLFRINLAKDRYEITSTIKDLRYINFSTKKVLIKRVNGIYYLKLDDDFSKLGTYDGPTFNVPVTIGASLDSNGNPQRYFKGTLTNVNFKVSLPEGDKTYKVVFNSNSPSETTTDQIIKVDDLVTLKPNSFTRDSYLFMGWNTERDGSGISYTDEQQIDNMASADETITLYAQWLQIFNYYVNFDANGGSGNMSPQQMVTGTAQNLNLNTYQKSNRIFVGWNTKADRSGTFYKNGESVINLVNTSNQNITLYAVWATEYFFDDEEVFTGSNAIKTTVMPFSSTNINKDFEISFEITSRDKNQPDRQSTLMSCMNEAGKPWPGIVYRRKDGSTDNEQLKVNVSTSLNADSYYAKKGISKVTLKRINKILYLNFNDTTDQVVVDMSTLTTPFDVPISFGASLDKNGNPQRYFKGTLSNMTVIIYE